MTIATVYVSDERYQAQRPDHIHRQCESPEAARIWVDLIEVLLGTARSEVLDFPEHAWRCPTCGWIA